MMLLHFVSTSDQHIISAAADNYEIIRNETVTTLYKIEHAFRLTDATLPCKEKSNAKYVGKRTVQSRRRSELCFQDRLNATVEFRCLELGAHQRRATRSRTLFQSGRKALALADKN